MGYTHYWKQRRDFTLDEWRDIAKGVKRLTQIAAKHGITLLRESDEAGTPPEITEDLILFNGAGDDGHETFYLSRKNTGLSSCKTNERPYDAAVCAILAYLDHAYPAAIEVTSDGDTADWRNGLELARLAWPDAGRIDAPRAVRD